MSVARVSGSGFAVLILEFRMKSSDLCLRLRGPCVWGVGLSKFLRSSSAYDSFLF